MNYLSIEAMVQKSYDNTNSLIVKDSDDNVFFLSFGVYIVNGKIQSLSLNALKKLFHTLVGSCKWCEFDGQFYDFRQNKSNKYLVFE